MFNVQKMYKTIQKIQKMSKAPVENNRGGWNEGILEGKEEGRYMEEETKEAVGENI